MNEQKPHKYYITSRSLHFKNNDQKVPRSLDCKIYACRAKSFMSFLSHSDATITQCSKIGSFNDIEVSSYVMVLIINLSI